MKSYRNAMGLAAATAAVALAAACGGGDAEGDGLAVDRSSFSEQDRVWPFSLNEGRLFCQDGAVYFQTPTGESYGVNGVAIESGDYPPPDPIWLDAPQAGEEEEETEGAIGSKAPLNDMIEVGEQEC